MKIIGLGLALRGVEGATDLLSGDLRAAAPAVRPADRLGQRGLRYATRATQLALSAAAEALNDIRGEGEHGPTGVVVSSTLGNLSTVCAVTSTIAEEGTRGVSPMDLPNASPNIIASSVAIRFGLRGPNLMVSNGGTSGVDALFWARSLLASGRARRVLVVGVEPSDEATARLLGEEERDGLDGAVALVLAADDDPAPALAHVGGFVRERELSRCLDRLSEDGVPGLWLTPERWREPAPAAWHGVSTQDVSVPFGRASGAFGVLQCAVATVWLREQGTSTAVITAGESGDVVSGCVLAGVS